jgi:hypothetical protein
MRQDPNKPERMTARLLDGLLGVHVAVFLALYTTDAVFALMDEVRFLRRPVELYCLMVAPILLRVHAPDYRRNGFASTLALWRDHRQVLIPFLGLIALSFLTALEPGANVADREGKAVFILLYRFASSSAR